MDLTLQVGGSSVESIPDSPEEIVLLPPTSPLSFADHGVKRPAVAQQSQVQFVLRDQALFWDATLEASTHLL